MGTLGSWNPGFLSIPAELYIYIYIRYVYIKQPLLWDYNTIVVNMLYIYYHKYMYGLTTNIYKYMLIFNYEQNYFGICIYIHIILCVYRYIKGRKANAILTIPATRGSFVIPLRGEVFSQVVSSSIWSGRRKSHGSSIWKRWVDMG